ncbi:MAG: hypothetical protein ACK4SZ_08220 [Allosphingosinicella sp.]|uniref:hypothetical protein n=1 Tax=Allosphingosinicella sp. TaxID=2823234 RepID=UPI00394EC423
MDERLIRSGPQPHAPASQELAATDATEQGAPPPAAYDPADYRWVPVRRRPRYDGWTEEKQRRFIVLADTGLVSAAALCDPCPMVQSRPEGSLPSSPSARPRCRPPRPRPSRTPPWPVRTLVTIGPARSC